MLVTFRTKAYADITMFGDVAVRLLKLMGHSGTVPGAMLAEDIAVALERLKGAVEADKQTSAAAQASARRRRAEFFALWASEDTMREELIQKTEAEMERVQRLRGYL